MSIPLRTQRLFVSEPLAEDAQVALAPDQAHYVNNVIRLPEGGALLLFNGQDGEWLAHRIAGPKRAVQMRIERRIRDQTPLGTVDYAFAPLKHARLDYMVQKAVEMGVGRLSPVVTRHTQVARVNLDRMRANAIEAAEQCGILAIPDLDDPLPLERWLGGLPAERLLVFCDEAAPVADPIAALTGAPAGAATLLIGPEGGFAAEERAMLRARPRTLILSLGPRILRADTAAIAALALIQATRGDLRG
ncbi:16S rRNA (uracil(1498)-N(3))-methyltransferase [Aquabacter spiritensis]|uniref:Ribosomal RNA small subunit methyltransferase E n=1 Tax=Aquabacter spiritensis TaxID=933073 RepID=A0A4R3LQR7_9HYPH|nr:16S rRNA (uracil(1498)-N(3))-methyltransferase [Aquabacter spiritensis]TCT02601.1 16S rRNA (uracil1498-N3)-methyltransferase [Aquabacter spiritensis]